MKPLNLYLFLLQVLLFLSCLLYSNPLFPQENSDQSSTSLDHAQELDRLSELIDESLSTNPPQARGYAKRVLEVAETSGQAALRAKAYLLAGKTWSSLTSYDSAELFLDAAQTISVELNDQEFLGAVAYEQGKIAANKRTFALAMERYHQALALWEKARYQLGIAKAFGGIADVYSMQSDYEDAIRYCNQAIDIFQQLGESRLEAGIHNELAYNYLFQGDYELALGQVNQALSLMIKEQATPLDLARIYNTRGNIYKYMDRYEEALADYRSNLELCKKGSSQRGEMVSYANIGHTFLLKKDYEAALPYTLKAIEAMINLGDLRNLWENYMHASDIYAGLGDHENANRYTWLYAKEVERQYEEELAQLGSELAQKYETGQREATILLQQQKIDQQKIIQWLIGGVVTLLAIVLILLFNGYRQKKRTNAQLNMTNAQLEKKNAENELLLKEIHHRVKNNLQTISSLLNLQSASITDESALEAVKESQNRVRSMALIHQKLYQGENLAAVEMKDYLSTMGEAMKKTFGKKAAQVSLEIPMEELELDVDTAIPLGLIVNELLTNSLKYAFPDNRQGKIHLSIVQEPTGQLRLKIADNGVGNSGDEKIDPSGTGFGSRLVSLLTMQLGGKMEQYNEGGLATIIRFKPLSNLAA